MTHSNVFYILAKDGFHAERNAIPIPNKPGLDLFRIGFNISDGKTGQSIKKHDTEESMQGTIQKIESDEGFRKRIIGAIEKALQQPNGLSPRYSRPDEKYEEIFPPKTAAKRTKSESKQVSETKRKEEQTKYEQAVSNAEKAIYGKKPVINIEVKEKPIVLCLFRENNITVPPKVKAWIVSSLCSIDFKEGHHIWSFHYNGELEPSFRGFFDQLVIALDRKHGGIQLKGISTIEG